MNEIPKLGFGTGGLKENICYDAVNNALNIGYRLFDTAAFYENENDVARAIKDCNVSRNEVYIISKLWNTINTYDEVIVAFEETLERLDTDYLDLYLLHWPKSDSRNIEVWKALEELKNVGKILDIGVSNFSSEQLDVLMKNTSIKPLFNQIELHPHYQQKELVNFCKNNDIKIMSYGQFGKGNFSGKEILQKIANNNNKTIHQIILNWLNENDVFTIPKSGNKNRATENFEALNFQLTNEELNIITEMDLGERYYSIFT